MGAKRPGYTPNVQANLRALDSNTIFLDVKPDTVNIVRFLPPPFENGSMFFQSINHYGFKQQDDPSRGRALACLRQHGTEETGQNCWVCRFVEAAEELVKTKKHPEFERVIKTMGGNPARPRWYAQVLLGERMAESKKIEYRGPKLLALPKSAATDAAGLLSTNEKLGEAYFTDPDEGQALIISRTGSGLKSRYKVERSGLIASLDEIFPDWVDKYMDEAKFLDKLALDVVTPEEQKAAARQVYAETLDWAMLEAEYNL